MNRTRVAILGAGQLSQMLAESALTLGLQPVVLASGSGEPASLVRGVEVVQGEDHAAYARLFSGADFVAFENEFVSREKLETAARQVSPSPRFLPSLEAIEQVQDKLNQKRVLEELGIPTSTYEAYEAGNLGAWIKESLKRFSGGAVFKWSKFGYDGKGTWISRMAGGDGEVELIEGFCKQAFARGSRVYVEEKIDFVRELAIVGALSVSGEFKAWPLVISEQEQGICHWVKGPARAFGVNPALETQALKHIEAIARRLGLFGVSAVEMFETRSGEICVNELAPRVHNTGHYTQDASTTSQFENHWRALLGLSLGSTETKPAFAMLNLIGAAPSVPASREGLHWYGKTELRAGRKLGHVNVWAPSVAELPIAELERYEKNWKGIR